MTARNLTCTLGALLLLFLTGFLLRELVRRADAAYARERSASGGLILPQTPSPPSATAILTLRFDRASAPEGLAQGWALPELGSGVWSLGPRALLQLPPVAAGRAVDLELTFAPFVHTPAVPAQNIVLSAGAQQIATWRLTDPAITTVHATIPAAARRPDGGMEIRMDLPNAASPARTVPGSTDARQIAIKLMRIRIAG